MGFNLIKKGIKGATVAMVGFTVAMVAGVKSALDFGGRMSDVAAQTGISVKEIMIWEEAMRQGGAEGETFGQTISKMQKNIADAGDGLMEKKRALDVLGLSYRKLDRMAPAAQFQLIAKRISEVESPTHRAQAALNLLGRSGAKMFATFGDGGARGKAIQTLGSQVEIFSRQAKTFDRMSDIIGGVKVKLRGFFAGFADKIAGPLSAILEKFDKMDFAKYGAALVEKIEPWLDPSKWGDLARSFGSELMVWGDKFLDLLVKGAVVFGERLWAAINGADRVATPGALLKNGGALNLPSAQQRRKIAEAGAKADAAAKAKEDAKRKATIKGDLAFHLAPAKNVLDNLKQRGGMLGGKLGKLGAAGPGMKKIGQQMIAGIGDGLASTFKTGAPGKVRPGETIEQYFARTAKASTLGTPLQIGNIGKPLDVFSEQLAKRQATDADRRAKRTPAEKQLTVLEKIAVILDLQKQTLADNLGPL